METLFSEAILMFYVLSYGQLLDSVCSVLPLTENKAVSDLLQLKSVGSAFVL